MGSKRDNTELDGTPPQPPNKRRREQAKTKSSEPKTDATYGQRFAFPSLDEPTHPSDDDLEFEDEADALAYLRSVRQEANGIPHLLVAPKAGPQLPPHLSGGDDTVDRSIYDNGIGDSRGYYQDGAYTAAPDSVSSEEGEISENEDWDAEKEHAAATAATTRSLREAYFTSLTSQFTTLRAQLTQDPPHELVKALDKDHGTEVGHFGAKGWTFRVWGNRVRYTDPLPVQVAAMDRRNALKVLRIILGGKFIRRGYELRERTSRWIWALLARLPERDEMDYTEVGWVRELGKRAVLMMVSMAQMAVLEEIDGDLDGEKVDDAEADDGNKNEDEIFLEEVEVNDKDEVTHGIPADDPNNNNNKAADTAATPADSAHPEEDDGEVDMDIDDGEVSDTPTPSRDIQADIAAAKARLLAQLESPLVLEEPPAEPAIAESVVSDQDKARAQFNVRATLNMILTVAGELYGQRDLLEFRDPFAAL